MRIAVVGTGYVGLVAGAGFAECGNDVICVDSSEERIELLRRGEIPFYEPGLAELVKRNGQHERLSFSTDTKQAVGGADAVFIAVGTPDGPDGPDLSQVESAARAIGKGLTGWTVIANKSTVPVGTAARVRAIIGAETEHEFAVVSNPEFLKEGNAVTDFLKPDRIIVGCDDVRAAEVLHKIYSPLLRISDRFSVMDVASAELTKYAANAMLATRISFMNELAALAEKVGADIEHIRRGIGSDSRIGPRFLFAGVGFGGSCFPKDLHALSLTGQQHGVELSVVAAAREANQRQKRLLASKIGEYFGDRIRGARIAVWGLSYKPETDDIRDAPSLDVIHSLLEAGAQVVGYDPAAMANVRSVLGARVELATDMYAAVEQADALALMTEWHEFRRPSYSKLLRLMRAPVLFDGRNQWDPAEVRARGFVYRGIGRRTDGVVPDLSSALTAARIAAGAGES